MSMSLGGKGNDGAMKAAVNNAVKAGIPVIVAAGNDGLTSKPDACTNTPAHIPSAITVGATDKPSGLSDKRARYSSWGKCLDLFAPGSDIVSASHKSTTGTATMSGTSMACPHVSGVAALMMGEDPQITPSAVVSKLTSIGVRNNIQDIKSGSPNIMLQIGTSDGTGPVKPTKPPVKPTKPPGTPIAGPPGKRGKRGPRGKTGRPGPPGKTGPRGPPR